MLKFGTSGLRGLVTEMTDRECYINVRGFLDACLQTGAIQPGTRVALAGDLRSSTGRILKAAFHAIADAGCRTIYGGRIPSPALAYFGFSQRIPSIMVTGSHIPDDRNGIKFNLPSGELLKKDEPAILSAVAGVRA
jgi:phosphomannomutase